MRRVLLPLLFVVLCLGLPGLCRGGEAAVAAVPGAAASADAGATGAVGASGVPADAAAPAAPADAAIPGAGSAASAPVPAADAGNPIPDVPPPGWTEKQLADLRAMEIHIRHRDTWPDKNYNYGSGSPYNFTLFVSDGGVPGNRSPLCVRRLHIVTDMGDLMVPKEGFSPLEAGECVSYHSLGFTRGTDIPAPEIRIRSATMDVAPERNSPVSSELRGLDAVPALRSVPLPNVTLTMGKRPLPKMPAKLLTWVASGYPWPPPEKLRVHLDEAFEDPDQPGQQCVSFAIDNLPRDSWSFSRFLIRTNVGDYTSHGTAMGRGMAFCGSGGFSHIDIEQGTVWSHKEVFNAAPLLVDDGFTPLPFVTDKGPLPPTSSGLYPFRPWADEYEFKPRVRPR